MGQSIEDRSRRNSSGSPLLYLPPYSPDLNPIEKAWAKLKQLLRAAKAHPAAYADLVVRVSGFAARFVTLSARMQDEIARKVAPRKAP